MRRATQLLLLAAGLGGGAAPLDAQTGTRLPIYFKETSQGTDTVYAALSGGVATVTIASDNLSGGEGLGRFRVRIYFDPSRLNFLSARSSCPDSIANPISTVTGATFVELSANGCGTGIAFSSINVATAQWRQLSATGGSLLYLSPDTLFDFAAADRTLDGEGDLAELCAALTVWGDVDDDATVNSRDALIALTNAVGLPTTGFPVSQGDVDADGRVSSRDALFMLSYAIGRPTGTRVAQPIARFCAPQFALPAALYYQTEGTGPATPGQDGLTIRPAADTVATIVGDSSADWFTSSAYNHKYRPRLSPDGSKLLYACGYNTSTFSAQICTTNADGSGGIVRLSTLDASSHASPDWSPAGDSIVFVRDGDIYVMKADGTGARLAVNQVGPITSVAWNPQTGARTIAYTMQGCNGDVRVFNLDTGGQTLIAAGDCTAARGEPDMVDWSPAGDSLAFDMFIDNRKAVIVAPAATSAPLSKRVSYQLNSTNEPLWRSDGMLFQVGGILYGQLYFRRNDGMVFRLTRTARDLHFPGIKK